MSAIRLLLFVLWLPSAFRALLPVFRRQAARFGRGPTFNLQPSAFAFLKNEATDLLENKGSALAKIGNEATVEGSRRSAVGSRQSPQAADPATSLGGQPADCVLPTALCLLLSLLRLPSVFVALVWVLRRQAARFGRDPAFNLRPSAFAFLKNEATDLLDNKGSALAEIRNEATVEGSWQSAVAASGPIQAPFSEASPPTAYCQLPLPSAYCLLPPCSG